MTVKQTVFTYPCKFPMRAQARKAGPPKKSFKSSMLILKPWKLEANPQWFKIYRVHYAQTILTQEK